MPLVLLLLSAAVGGLLHVLLGPLPGEHEAAAEGRETSTARGAPGEPGRAAARARKPEGGKARAGAGPRIPETSPFHSRAACEAFLKGRAPRPKRGPRIGTWNVRWFPYGDSARKHGPNSTDLDFLACAIAALDVDVLAVQEFVQDPDGRNALLEVIARLDQLSGGRYRSELDDCTGSGFQHLGFLYDTRRVAITGARPLAAFNPGRSACDRSLRPGYGMYARFASGPDLHLVTVHLDSGVAPRDFGHRAQLAQALARAQRELARIDPDRDLLVLGDFNSMGCSECQPQVSAEQELRQQTAELAPRDLTRVLPPEERACTHYYRGEPGLLDHVLARAGMEELPEGARVEVLGPCGELACRKASRASAPQYWDLLSDHCPIVIELLPEDRDPQP